MFEAADLDNNGYLDEVEWKRMVADEGTLHVLEQATGLDAEELEELHQLVRGMQPDEDLLPYEDFIALIEDESKACDRRAILKVMTRMQLLENRMHERFQQLGDDVELNTEKIASGILLSGGASPSTSNTLLQIDSSCPLVSEPSNLTPVGMDNGTISDAPSPSRKSPRKPTFHQLPIMRNHSYSRCGKDPTKHSDHSKATKERSLYSKIGQLHEKSDAQQARIAELENTLARLSAKGRHQKVLL